MLRGTEVSEEPILEVHLLPSKTRLLLLMPHSLQVDGSRKGAAIFLEQPGVVLIKRGVKVKVTIALLTR